MTREPYNILFLCAGNSSRSIMAECILGRLGQGRFRAFSAGSHPRGHVDPDTLALLQSRDHDVSGLRSKSWAEFARPETPKMHILVTLCAVAAKEVCGRLAGRAAADPLGNTRSGGGRGIGDRAPPGLPGSVPDPR